MTSCEVRRSRWNWLGHILRRDGENDCFTALGWTSGRSEGKRKTKNYLEKDSRERTKQSWVEDLEVAKVVAQDRKCWSDSVEALCDET